MSGPKISIETPLENQVYEITYDGREILQPPLSMSENLARLAAKIDWSRADGSDGADEPAEPAAEPDADGEQQVTSFQQPAWPWESVRNKIRDAYTEVCVLSDVLSIARHKRYMVLDGVTQDAPESRQLVQVISKKKGLGAGGADPERRRTLPLSTPITGLVTLAGARSSSQLTSPVVGPRSVGSRFWLSGTFEVKKAEETPAPAHWNDRLEAAQNVLFCKELIAQLVNIVTHGYDSVHRTTFLINVLEDSLRCVCRDGRVLTLSYDSSELQYIIFCQVSQHNMLAAQSLGRILGWTVRSSGGWQGGGCVLAAPSGQCYVAVRCQPHGEPIQVAVAQSPRPDFFPTALVTEHKWEQLGGAFRQVKWEKMEGRNFLNKMELLMANLSNSTANIM
ncbi:mediator of RNA polymerase II transcription subunit 17-like [Pollicipes pollicipes]|uniref:mediator of RNA polymerase II transcription subunit 17-like n=1 Tax=Pollicipes pollicipes TaxID=41117 RepID=UPI0018849E06|nr:mediator of RNA polymerase II transcription subunit 17-like [Pollicipes pollicipes]